MNGVEIRASRADDCDRLTELARLAKGSHGYPKAWMDLWAEDLVLTPDYVSSHAAFVAQVGGKVVGVAVVEDHGDFWQLEHVWVDPRSQGGGVGRALVSAALASAGAARPGIVRLVADAFAESFYIRLGATRVGEQAAPMPGAPDRMLPVLEFQV